MVKKSSNKHYKKKLRFVAHHLMKKIDFLNAEKTNQVVKTWSRSSSIMPAMVGHTIAIHNGREHISISIKNSMIGHKLGEFVETRTFKAHADKDKKSQR